jgi:hypothetical protein
MGSRGVPSQSIRNAVEELRAAFENSSLDRIIPRRPFFRDFIPNYREADQASSNAPFVSPMRMHKGGTNLLGRFEPMMIMSPTSKPFLRAEVQAQQESAAPHRQASGGFFFAQRERPQRGGELRPSVVDRASVR